MLTGNFTSNPLVVWSVREKEDRPVHCKCSITWTVKTGTETNSLTAQIHCTLQGDQLLQVSAIFNIVMNCEAG